MPEQKGAGSTPQVASGWWAVYRNREGDELLRWGSYKSRETAEYVASIKRCRYFGGAIHPERVEAGAGHA